MKKILVLLSVVLITGACSNRIKQVVGVTTPGPDEYKVQKNKSLEVPPHYDLPEPVAAATKSPSASAGLHEEEKASSETSDTKRK